MRLIESLELWWNRDGKLRVDITGEHPMLRIPAELEKGHRDRLLPMAPEFAEFLSASREAERTGPVFKPQAKRRREGRVGPDRVCHVVSLIGEAAGIAVATDPHTGKVKWASCHDMRRSFGQRWAARIMPPDLMVLMRHESIDTTLRYYVGQNAEATAETLWQAHKRAIESNTLGNTTSVRPDSAVSAGDSNPTAEATSRVGPEGFEPPTKGL